MEPNRGGGAVDLEEGKEGGRKENTYFSQITRAAADANFGLLEVVCANEGKGGSAERVRLGDDSPDGRKGVQASPKADHGSPGGREGGREGGGRGRVRSRLAWACGLCVLVYSKECSRQVPAGWVGGREGEVGVEAGVD